MDKRKVIAAGLGLSEDTSWPDINQAFADRALGEIVQKHGLPSDASWADIQTHGEEVHRQQEAELCNREATIYPQYHVRIKNHGFF